MSTALALFHALCDVANALECLRNAHAPASETWLALTCLAQELDAMIDLLVQSQGLGGQDDA
jgi:hypothetical protein